MAQASEKKQTDDTSSLTTDAKQLETIHPRSLIFGRRGARRRLSDLSLRRTMTPCRHDDAVTTKRNENTNGASFVNATDRRPSLLHVCKKPKRVHKLRQYTHTIYIFIISF